jgi:AI-2 transport protein TqsA
MGLIDHGVGHRRNGDHTSSRTPRARDPPTSVISGARMSTTRSLDALLRAVVLVAGVCIIIASLRAASVVLVPLMVALFITALGAAPVFWLTRSRVPYRLAVTLVGAATAGALVGLVFLGLHWQEDFVVRFPRYRDEMAASLETLRLWLIDVGLSRTVEQALESSRGTWFVPASTRSFQILSATVFVLVLVGFLLVELTGMPIKLQAAYGAADPRTAALHATAVRLMGYFRIKSVSSFVTGTLAGVTCWLVGVDYPVLWGLVAFLFNFAPTVGSLVAAIPPVFLAWLMLGWEQAVVVAGAYLVLNVVIGAIIEPKLLGDRRIGRTLRRLFLEPGRVTVEYVEDRRRHYTHPVKLLLFSTMLVVAALSLTGRLERGLQVEAGFGQLVLDVALPEGAETSESTSAALRAAYHDQALAALPWLLSIPLPAAIAGLALASFLFRRRRPAVTHVVLALAPAGFGADGAVQRAQRADVLRAVALRPAFSVVSRHGPGRSAVRSDVLWEESRAPHRARGRQGVLRRRGGNCTSRRLGQLGAFQCGWHAHRGMGL